MIGSIRMFLKFGVDLNQNYERLSQLALAKFRNSSLTLFFPMFPFHPPRNIRKPLVFCFQGDQMGTLVRKGL